MTKTPIKPSKQAKEEAPASTSNDLLTALLKTHENDHYNDIVPKNIPISTGSLLLDSYVKVRSGGVVRLVAKTPEAGKSSESFVLAANYMATMDRAKTIYVKAEGRLSPEMQARTGLTFVTSPANWATGTVFILSCNVFETVADILNQVVKEMHDKEEHLCIIIDSLDGLILKDDLESKGIQGGGMVAGVPKLTKLLFRHLALPITHYDVLLVITGQYSAEISIDPYAPKIPRLGDASGGSSIPHQCDYILSYQPRYGGDLILEKPDEKPDPIKNKTVGIWVKIEIKKSATDTSGTKIQVPIKKGRVGCAIWVEKEVVDMALQWQLLRRNGAWFSFAPEIIKEAKDAGIDLKEKLLGMTATYEYFEQDVVVFQWFLDKFKKLLGTS